MSTLTGHATATSPQQRHRKEARLPLFIDASALARDLRAAISGEVRFDDGSRALYATDGSNYRQVPIGVVVPQERGRRDRHHRRLPSPRGADPLARRRHEPHRRLLQRRRRDGLVQVRQQGALGRSRTEARAGAAGVRPRQAPRRGREAWSDLRPGPLDAQPLHAGRDDRQQLVRRPLADRPGNRPDLRPDRRAGDHALRRDPHDRRRHQRRGAGADHPGRRPPRGDLRAAEGPPRPIRRPDPRPVSQDPPQGLRVQPRRPAARARLPRRPGAGRLRGDVRHDPRGAAPPGPQPADAVAPGPRLSGRLRGGRARRGDPRGQADRPGGARRHPGQGHEDQGDPSPGRQAAAARRRLAARRVRRRDQGRGRRQGQGADVAAQGALQCPVHEALRRRGRGGAPVEGARVGARGHRAHPRPQGRLGGLGGLGRPSSQAEGLPPRPPRALPEVRLQRRPVRAFRPGVRPHPDRLRSEDERGRPAFPLVTSTRRPT